MDKRHEDPSKDATRCEFPSSECISNKAGCCCDLRNVILSECFEFHGVVVLFGGLLFMLRLENCKKSVPGGNAGTRLARLACNMTATVHVLFGCTSTVSQRAGL